MKSLIRAALVAHALTLAASAQAGIFTTVGAYVAHRFSGLITDEVYANTTQPVSATGSTYSPDWDYFPPAGPGIASVWGRADVGMASLSTTASGMGFAPLTSAGWTDQIVVDAAGRTGTRGTISFQLRYDWAASADANAAGLAYSTPYIDVNFKPVGGAFNSAQYADVVESLTHDCYNASPCERSDTVFAEHFGTAEPTFANGLATFSLNVVFGQAYFITIAINESLIGGNATASASGSLFWNGMQAATDASGQVLTDYAVTSAIGLNYKAAVSAVPEPESFVLLPAGLLLMAAFRRRRG